MRALTDRSPSLRRRDLVVAAVLGASAVVLAFVAVMSRPGAVLTADFLFSDQGHNLLIAQTLLRGGTLYRDVFSQYGPLPAYAHALAAALFGNTPLVYLGYLAWVSGVNVALFYVLARRASSEWVAALATLAFMATSLDPGSLVGGYTVAAYIPLERTAFLLVTLAWRSPETRTFRRAIAIGCALGAWQGVRFGGVVFAAAAIAIVDAGAICRARGSAAQIWAWIGSLAVTAMAAVATELLWAAWAFLTLSPQLAIDVLWPFYILPTYKYWVTPGLRWLAWEGWRMMIAQYLLPAAAGLAGVVAFCRWLVERPMAARPSRAPAPLDDGNSGAVFIPLCFFLLAFFFFFREVHHFRQFMWTLVPAAAWELERRRVAVRAAVTALWAPGIGVFLKSVFVPVALGPLLAIALPSGGTIYAGPEMAGRIQFLDRFVSTEAKGLSVLFTNCGSGWFYAYGVAHETRHTWIWAPELIRPYEEGHLIASLDRTGALIDCDDDNPVDPTALYPRAVAEAIRARITPWTSGGGCRIYRLRPPR